jgi:AcrR family transcriptional regulator
VTARVTPKTDTRQALIEAALQVFLERGFARATTREIARRAGLSEGTMYRHFVDKYELFHEVFFSLATDIGGEFDRLPERAGQGTLRDNLEYVLSLIGQMQARLSSLMASIWADPDLSSSFDAHAKNKVSGGFERPEPVPMVAAYIRAEQELGRVRRDLDPTEAGAVIVSIPFASGMERALRASFTTRADSPDAEAEDFPFPRDGALDILVRGLAP